MDGGFVDGEVTHFGRQFVLPPVGVADQFQGFEAFMFRVEDASHLSGRVLAAGDGGLHAFTEFLGADTAVISKTSLNA